MLRKFTDLISEAINDGHERGINLFMESLETDLQKDMVFENHGVQNVVGQLFQEAGYEWDFNEEINEQTINEAVASMDPYFQESGNQDDNNQGNQDQ